MKEPFLSDWVVICAVPFASRTCTVAPVIDAPDASTTVPDSGVGCSMPSSDFSYTTVPLTLAAHNTGTVKKTNDVNRMDRNVMSQIAQ